MKCKLKTTSLEGYFQRQAVRWGLIGLGMTLLFALPCVFYSAKIASERQVLYTARSALRAFRPMILQDNIRDVELQMRKALELQPGESATIFDPNLKAIYPLKEENSASQCKDTNEFCWGKGYRILSVLQPIYFDDHSEEGLFGYLELTLKPTLDLSILSFLSILLLVVFIIQAFGLSSALSQSAKQIVGQLSFWADHLKNKPGEFSETREKVPFSELKSMQEAVDGLYFEIEKLREKSAKDAKTEAQVAILREIGHDLKTPHSQLAKYFALLVDTVQTTGTLKENEIRNVERTLKRMGELLRHVLVFSFGNSRNRDNTELGFPVEKETQTILNDFRNDPEVISKEITIHSDVENHLQPLHISKVGYYRLLENLLRNAIEAVPSDLGEINVELKVVNGATTLSVRDNGSGIPPHLLDKIFDFDFTTKPERGTGLGLGIVHKICCEFGSKVFVNSEVGQGSTFTVTFQPFKSAEEPNDEEGTPYVEV